jgi:long-subunit fatty acid transport protein
MKVIPMLGFRWTFAPSWELAVGFPRTGVSYTFSDVLSLSAGVSMQGGTYHISKAPAAGLGNTYLDYREFRAGLGAEYRMSKNLSVVVDGGMVLDREFDYYDRNVKLDGKSASYGRFSLKYQF